MSAAGPLAGITVLDFTRVLSGPHATRMLCDMGAEVIKVEPPRGDLTRFTWPRVGSMSTYFAQQNVGKRNISVDTSLEAGRHLLARLAGAVDVVIENFRPGVMEKMGLHYEAVSATNPRVIYASISGYGQTGPWRTRRAYAPVVNAEAGITKSQADAHGAPYANDPHSHADVYTGIEAAAAILAALHHRHVSGRGQRIDVSMAETMMYVNEHAHDQLWDRDVAPGVIRSFRPGDYPVLTVADGTTVVVSGHPAERGTFDFYAAAMGRPELTEDPRFADVPERLEHLDEIMAMITEWAAGVPDADELERRLAEVGLAMGVLRGIDEIADTEWAREREAVARVPDRSGGFIAVPNTPWRFSDTPSRVAGEPRFRGEDNADVCRELLDMSDNEIAALVADGVLVSRGPATPR